MRMINTILLSILVIFSSCKKESNPVEPSNGGNNSNLQIGELVDLKTQTIGTSGGTITVEKPGDKLDGLEIIFPPNSFTENKTFKISYAEIKNHQLGQYFNPVSPLIKISYEGGYSDQPMKVKIPIKLPKDYFAMGFFYDEKTGLLEGLPVDALDSTSITISTRTFSSSSSLLGKAKSLRVESSVGNLIISSIKESLLSGQTIITSGFTPGVDDWEFINYGSYIASSGHCAGQSMTAMWYYYEKKLKGEPSLFHRFDEVNDKTKPFLLWQDNPKGYKWASTIQEDFNFDWWVQKIIVEDNFPFLTWNAFALAMLVTGEPQFVIIRQSTPDYAGHALIVYKINIAEGKLYVADPNFPNNRDPNTGVESIRTINFVNGKFEPYPSSLNAGSSKIMFDEIGFFGKTANVQWDQISKRYGEFLDGIIGDDRFPDYQIYIQNDDDNELTDTLITEKDTLEIYCESVACDECILNTNHLQDFIIYNDKGDLVSNVDNQGIATLQLKVGLNKLGFYILGASNGKWHYLDFKWFNITKVSPIKIESAASDGAPILIPGEKEKEYTFIARHNGRAPKNGKAKFDWYFGDNTAIVTNMNDSVVTHTFTQEGSFIINLKMYDDTKLIGEAIETARIGNVIPYVENVTPYQVIVGDTITIIGKNFGTSPQKGKVYFDDVLASQIVSWTNDKIKVRVPEGTLYESKVFVEIDGNRSTSEVFIEVKNWWIPFRFTFSYINYEAVCNVTLSDGTQISDLSSFYNYPFSFKWTNMNFTADTTFTEIQNSGSSITTTSYHYNYSGELNDNGMIMKSFLGSFTQTYSSNYYYNNALRSTDSSITTIEVKFTNIPYYGIFSFFPSDGSSSFNNPNFEIANAPNTFELTKYDIKIYSIDYGTTPPTIKESGKTLASYGNNRSSQVEIGGVQ